MAPSVAPQSPHSPSAQAAPEPRFLVVDDNPTHRRLIARALGTVGRVREAARGEEVLAACQAEAVDLVCLDLSLPEMSGYEVCRRLRAAGLPCLILAISDRLNVTDRAFAKEVGADDILEKPFKIRELNRRVDYLLRMSHMTRPGPGGQAGRPRP